MFGDLYSALSLILTTYFYKTWTLGAIAITPGHWFAVLTSQMDTSLHVVENGWFRTKLNPNPKDGTSWFVRGFVDFPDVCTLPLMKLNVSMHG